MRLKDKVAIVTGGGSGFGEGIVRKFVAEGAKVLVVDRNLEGAERVATAVGDQRRARFRADVSSAADTRAMIEAAEEQLRAARHPRQQRRRVARADSRPRTCSEDEFDRIVAVNMKAIYLAREGGRAALQVAARRGVILNMASTAGVSPRPRLSWYNASKGWVITATRALAVELAPFGIRVVALNPVAGETPLLKTFMGEDTPEMRAKFLATIPIGRFSQPEDLGNAACFLCSDEASMITGVAMEVDGGRCI